MPGPIIAVTDSPFPSLDPAKAALARLTPDIRMARNAFKESILEVARDADAVLVTDAKLPADLIGELRRCKVIGRFGLDVDKIDLQAAADVGIVVTHVPDYCLREVSDHAMALLLALARKITFSNALVQSGRQCTDQRSHRRDTQVGQDNDGLSPRRLRSSWVSRSTR